MKPVSFGMLVTLAFGLLFVPAANGAEIKTLAWPVPQTIPGTTESHAILHNYGQGYWPKQNDGTEKLTATAHSGLDFIRMSEPGLPYYWIPPGRELTWDQVKAMAVGRVLYKEEIKNNPDGTIANAADLVLTVAHDDDPGSITPSTYNGNAWEYRHIAYEIKPGTNREWDVEDIVTIEPGTTGLPFLGVVAKSEHHAPHLHIGYAQKGASGWGTSMQMDNPLKFLVPNEDPLDPEIAYVKLVRVDDLGNEGGFYEAKDGAGRTIIRGNAQLLVQAFDRFDTSGTRSGVYSLGFDVYGPIPTPFTGFGNLAIPFVTSFVCDGADCGRDYPAVLNDAYSYPPDASGDTENKISPFPGVAMGTRYNFNWVITRSNGDSSLVDERLLGEDGIGYTNKYFWNLRQKKDPNVPNPSWYGVRDAAYELAGDNSSAVFPDGLYKVKVVAGDLSGKQAERVESIIIDNFMPSKPLATKAASGKGVCWQAATDTDIASYRVFRSEIGNQSACSPDLAETIGNLTYCRAAENVTGSCYEDPDAESGKL